MNETRKVSVTVELAPLDVLLLDATATHLGKDRSPVVAEALRCFFIVLPRPGSTPGKETR